MLAAVPNLKVVLEHATTSEAVKFVETADHPGGIGCTITPQHLLYSRNALFAKVTQHSPPHSPAPPARCSCSV